MAPLAAIAAMPSRRQVSPRRILTAANRLRLCGGVLCAVARPVQQVVFAVHERGFALGFAARGASSN
jgi:hypothetical protein